MAVGLGECLPELRQRDAPGRLRWAGGTERDRWCRMRNLPAGLGPGVRRSNPPALAAPVRRLWAAMTRVHKEELQVQSVCVFCNWNEGIDIGSISATTGALTRFFNPRLDTWCDHFSLDGVVIKLLSAIGQVTERIFQFMRDRTPQ